MVLYYFIFYKIPVFGRKNEKKEKLQKDKFAKKQKAVLRFTQEFGVWKGEVNLPTACCMGDFCWVFLGEVGGFGFFPLSLTMKKDLQDLKVL